MRKSCSRWWEEGSAALEILARRCNAYFWEIYTSCVLEDCRARRVGGRELGESVFGSSPGSVALFRDRCPHCYICAYTRGLRAVFSCLLNFAAGRPFIPNWELEAA